MLTELFLLRVPSYLHPTARAKEKASKNKPRRPRLIINRNGVSTTDKINFMNRTFIYIFVFNNLKVRVKKKYIESTLKSTSK
jgi:hypothetical protein